MEEGAPEVTSLVGFGSKFVRFDGVMVRKGQVGLGELWGRWEQLYRRDMKLDHPNSPRVLLSSLRANTDQVQFAEYHVHASYHRFYKHGHLESTALGYALRAIASWIGSWIAGWIGSCIWA